MKKNVLSRIKAKIPVCVKKPFSPILHFLFDNKYRKNELYKYKYRERKVTFGDKNPDKIFYIVRRVSEGEGFGSTYVNCLSDIAYADSKGWIPVVDQLNYYNSCLQEQDKKGKENAWEYYWLQPTQYSLNTVYTSKNVILGDAYSNPHWTYRNDSKKIYYDKEYRRYLLGIKNKYYKFTDEINVYLEECYNKELKPFLEKGKVLAVSTRSGQRQLYENQEYLNDLRGFGKSPLINELVDKIVETKNNFGCKYVYFSDDIEIANEVLLERLGEKIIFPQRLKMQYRDMGYENYSRFMQNRVYKYTLYYIKDIYLLSRCSSICAWHNSTTTVALLMNNMKYEHEEIIDLGTY